MRWRTSKESLYAEISCTRRSPRAKECSSVKCTRSASSSSSSSVERSPAKEEEAEESQDVAEVPVERKRMLFITRTALKRRYQRLRAKQRRIQEVSKVSKMPKYNLSSINHLCCKHCSVVSRFSGSETRSRDRKSLASIEVRANSGRSNWKSQSRT